MSLIRAIILAALAISIAAAMLAGALLVNHIVTDTRIVLRF